ncbi:MAG: hypothetical protein QME81_15175 [bacterium]|nr:hypothetical protein [bacterium]
MQVSLAETMIIADMSMRETVTMEKEMTYRKKWPYGKMGNFKLIGCVALLILCWNNIAFAGEARKLSPGERAAARLGYDTAYILTSPLRMNNEPKVTFNFRLMVSGLEAAFSSKSSCKISGPLVYCKHSAIRVRRYLKAFG